MIVTSTRPVTKKTRIGDCAEDIVLNYLQTRGNCYKSFNEYDEEKDLVYNGYYVEVKARTKIVKSPISNSFAMEENQWRKMDNVDINIFVNIPLSSLEHVTVYYVKDKTAFTVASFPGEKEKLRFYDISKMEIIHTLKDSTELYDLSFSKYKKS